MTRPSDPPPAAPSQASSGPGQVELAGGVQGLEAEVQRLQAELGEAAERERALRDELAAERRVSEEAQRARMQAEAASRAKSGYLANMSHELRTPLNSILGFAQLLERDRGLSEQHRENLLVISKAGEHLLGLINDILEMARIEAGRITLNETDFDIYRLISGVEEMFAVQARKKGLRLEVERDLALPRYVRTDEGKLRQVLINLLGNAIKFTSRGAVVLRARPAARLTDPGAGARIRLVFEVVDTGRGIAADEIGTLFQAFSQAQCGREAGEGTGLGLAISRQFVELMGGEIKVASQPDEGSTFTVELRAGLSSLAGVRAAREPRAVVGLAPDQPRYRVLVVDDGWQSRHLLVKLLSGLGFEVRGATNGLGALAQFEMWEPHMIFMDMRMPLLDGYEATRRIKGTERGQTTVVVGMTASAFEHNRAQVLAVGCDDFLRKPYRDHEICEKIGLHLGAEFLYEDVRISLAPPPMPAEGDLLAATAALPAEWRAELITAATRLDRKATTAMLDIIRMQDPGLAEAMLELVRQYRFDRVLALLAPTLDEHAPANPG
ncbi:MAG TPA: ATP-binding protein [Candidatus Nanopelagicales bacterium]|nr:ATP-binding protein [Candidatus Nanopelagicales bacterium]